MSAFKKKVQRILKIKKGNVSEEKKEIVKKEKQFVRRFLDLLENEVKEHPSEKSFDIVLNEKDPILSLYSANEALNLLKKHSSHKKILYSASTNYNYVSVTLRT